jgi:hypothetical protein
VSSNSVILAVVGGLISLALLFVGAWVKRIEGKDKLFRNSVSRDMRVMYAMKDDYNTLHTWALDVRSEWHALQRELKSTGAITVVRDLPPIPEPEWRRIEDGSDD